MPGVTVQKILFITSQLSARSDPAKCFLFRKSVLARTDVCVFIYYIYIYIKSSVKYGISGLRRSQIKDIYGSERVCSLTAKLYSHDVSCKSSPLKCIFFAQ